jgi:hypothetical protein
MAVCSAVEAHDFYESQRAQLTSLWVSQSVGGKCKDSVYCTVTEHPVPHKVMIDKS